MTDTKLFLTKVDETTGEPDVILNSDATEACNAIWENHVAKEIVTQADAIGENLAEELAEHVKALAEATGEKIGDLVEHLDDFLAEEVGTEITRLREENAALMEGLDLLARSVYSGGDYQEWIKSVARASEGDSDDGPGVKQSGKSYSAGVPDDAVTRNRKSIAGSTGSVGTTPGGSETGGAHLHETTLVQLTNGKVVPLRQHKQESFVAALCRHADATSGLNTAKPVPAVVDVARVPADQAARLLAEQVGNGQFPEDIAERIQEPAERAVVVHQAGRNPSMTPLVSVGASRGKVYAALEDLKQKSWMSGLE